MDVERTIEFLLDNAAKSDARFNARMDRIAASQTRSEARLDRLESVVRLAIRRGVRRERQVSADIRALTEAQRRTDEKLAEAQRRSDAKFERLIDMLVKRGTNSRPR